MDEELVDESPVMGGGGFAIFANEQTHDGEAHRGRQG